MRVVSTILCMQFMKNDTRTLCAFANPMEIDNHNKMEGTTLLEGKYWKRKLETIQKEYSKWRKFYYSQHEDPTENGTSGGISTSGAGNSVNQGDVNNDANIWDSFMKSPNHGTIVEGTRDDVDLQSMLNEEGIIVDLLLNTFQESSQANSELSSFLAQSSVIYTSGSGGSFTTSPNMSVAVPFPNPRDFYSATTNADLIQPGLGPLQPNLDEMEIDLDWLNTMNTVPTQQPQSRPLTGNVHTGLPISGSSENSVKSYDAKPDILSAIVTATTSSHFPTPVASYKQHEQTILASAQPPQPPSLIELQPSSVTGSNPQTSRHRGGGKQRSMLALNQQQQSIMPYPGPNYPTNVNGGHVTSISAKAKSPKHRLLQQRHLSYQSEPSVQQTSANSELVQLLTSPKPTPSPTNQRPTLTTLMPPAVAPSPVHPTLNGGGVHLMPPSLQPQASVQPHQPQPMVVVQQNMLVLGIPPPLATDYQQDHLAADFQNNQNGHHQYTDPNAEHRRSIHTNAEQNRRTSLKHGFEELRSLIPSLKDVSTSSHKISKAALLHKGGDQIRHIKIQCQTLENEAMQLKAAIETLEMDISAIQGSLPGLKIGQDLSNNANNEKNISVKLRQKKVSEDQTEMTLAFNNHVSNATGLNWKYWAFSRLMKPVFETYTNAVAGSASLGEMERSIIRWLEDKCSSVQMRQSAVTCLKTICTQTNILSDPRRLPHEVLELSRQPPELESSEQTQN